MVRIEFDLLGELLDTIFSLLGKYGRWMNARGKRICFIIWNVCTIYWMLRDFQLNLWSQGFFCLISICLNFWGYFNWKKKGFD
jgi:hypothetical protein